MILNLMGDHEEAKRPTDAGVLIMQGDCLELLKDIPDGSVDMVLCDLPYGTTACKWDTVIPFEPLWAQYKRLIKPNGAIVLFGSEPFSSKLRMSNLDWFKYDWVWVKSRTVGFLNAKNAPLKKHEIISVFSSGNAANTDKNRMPYFPQGLEEINEKRMSVQCADDTVVGNRPSRKKEYMAKYRGFPDSILNFGNEPKQSHPTQKPVWLCEQLILTYTNAGDTVLDCCMGSGSIGVACLQTGRKYIGMENDLAIFESAKRRLEGPK